MSNLELTYLYSPSRCCSSTVIRPAGRLSLKKKDPSSGPILVHFSEATLSRPIIACRTEIKAILPVMGHLPLTEPGIKTGICSIQHDDKHEISLY